MSMPYGNIRTNNAQFPCNILGVLQLRMVRLCEAEGSVSPLKRRRFFGLTVCGCFRNDPAFCTACKTAIAPALQDQADQSLRAFIDDAL